jgi:golgi phosphoprotein 3
MDTKLSLAEELLLLALNDEKGTVLMAGATGLPYGLAGALLGELIDAGLLRIEGKTLVAAPGGPARDEYLDGILSQVRSAKRARDLRYWVGRIGRSGGKIKAKIADRLVGKGILQREEHRVLLIFPTTRFPQVDPMPEYGARERIRAALRGMTPPDERTAALIGLAYACGLIGQLFDKSERREVTKKAKAIATSQPIGVAVVHTVEAVRAAAIAAASGS